MKSSVKIATVVGGYLGAFLAASTAVVLHIATTGGPYQQTSGGMYAFGDLILFIVIFGLLGVVPTGAALLFLRSHDRFWKNLSTFGIMVAVTGIVAAILFVAGRHTSSSPLATLAEASVLRILMAPFLAFIFLVCAVFSPHRFYRLTFVAATTMEIGVCVFGGLVWFVPLLSSP